MDSPQHHHAPHAMHSAGHVAPINLGLPLHAPHPAPGNNPFLAPPAPAPVLAPAPALLYTMDSNIIIYQLPLPSSLL